MPHNTRFVDGAFVVEHVTRRCNEIHHDATHRFSCTAPCSTGERPAESVQAHLDNAGLCRDAMLYTCRSMKSDFVAHFPYTACDPLCDRTAACTRCWSFGFVVEQSARTVSCAVQEKLRDCMHDRAEIVLTPVAQFGPYNGTITVQLAVHLVPIHVMPARDLTPPNPMTECCGVAALVILLVVILVGGYWLKRGDDFRPARALEADEYAIVLIIVVCAMMGVGFLAFYAWPRRASVCDPCMPADTSDDADGLFIGDLPNTPVHAGPPDSE